MQNGRKWRHAIMAVLVTAGLAGIPQSAVARDRCDNNRSVSSARYRNGRAAEYRNYGDSAYRNGRDSGNHRYGSGYGNDGYYDGDYRDYRRPRSAGKSAAIIGGSAAAGAVMGGITGGKKGAIIGGVIGGAGGLIYDRATRDRRLR